MKLPEFLRRLWGEDEKPPPSPDIAALRPALEQRMNRERVLTQELRRIEKVLARRGQ
jgi:hypothetical protein